MKRKGLLLFLTLTLLFVSGCSDKVKSIQTDELTISEYDGIEVDVKELAENSPTVEIDQQMIGLGAWNEVVEHTTINTYPEDKLTDEIEYIRQMYQTRADKLNVSYEDFVSTYMQMDVDDLEKEIEEDAKSRVRDDLIIDAIKAAEDLEFSEETIQKYMDENVRYIGYSSADKVSDTYDTRALEQAARKRIIQEWLVEHCETINEKSEG